MDLKTVNEQYLELAEQERAVKDSLLENYRAAYAEQGRLISAYQTIFRSMAKICESEDDVLVAQEIRNKLRKMGYLKEEE